MLTEPRITVPVTVRAWEGAGGVFSLFTETWTKHAETQRGNAVAAGKLPEHRPKGLCGAYSRGAGEGTGMLDRS